MIDIKQARSKKLDAEIKILIDWLRTRVDSGYDELTTLTMLQRKAERIKERVQRAGYEFLITNIK